MAKDNKIQDTIEFSLIAEQTVVNTTVKITATIAGIITPNVAEDALRENIRSIMKKFIDTAVWQISGIIRSKDDSGMEKIRLSATTRVSETENYALEERAEAASVKGMKISSVAVDTAPPTSMIEETESSLRITLLAKAVGECAHINGAVSDDHSKLGDDYRLGEVVFSRDANSTSNLSNSSHRNVSQMAMVSASYGSGFDEAGTLGNAVKLTMYAAIVLRRDH
jgi:hypothetical protein